MHNREGSRQGWWREPGQQATEGKRPSVQPQCQEKLQKDGMLGFEFENRPIYTAREIHQLTFYHLYLSGPQCHEKRRIKNKAK